MLKNLEQLYLGDNKLKYFNLEGNKIYPFLQFISLTKNKLETIKFVEHHRIEKIVAQ